MKKLFLLLSTLVIHTLATAQTPRLLNVLKFHNNSPLYSSIQYYYYSGPRGSDFKNGIIDYDSSVVYAQNWQKNWVYTKQYDTAGRNYAYSSDKINAGPLDYYKFSSTVTYDSAGHIVKEYRTESRPKNLPKQWEDNSTYDSTGQLTVVESLEGNIPFTQLEPVTKKIYTYDSNKNVSTVHMLTYDITNSKYVDLTLTTYKYNTSNLLTEVIVMTYDNGSSAFINDLKTSYIYNTNGLVQEYYDETWAGQWQPQNHVTYTYNGAFKMLTEEFNEYDKATKTYFLKRSETYTYNSNNDIATYSKVSWNNFYKQSWLSDKHVYVYNQYDQPDSIYIYKYTFPQIANPDTTISIDKHIYDKYVPLGSKLIAKQKAEVLLYPSPASTFINIHATFNEPVFFTASIVDMQGRVVRRWEETGIKQYARTILLTELPPGLYMLKLTGKDVNISRQFVITK